MSSAGRVGRRLLALLVIVIVAFALVSVVRYRRAHAPEPVPESVSTESTVTEPVPQTVPDADGANGVVEWVIDGDTIDVTFDDRTERVRLIGVDTPEIAHETADDRPGNPAECYGPEATEFTRALIPPGTAVRIERDVVSRDDYGRLLGYVFRADDDVFVNYELIHQGYARPLSIAPNTAYRATFADAASEAEQADLGLWTTCN